MAERYPRMWNKGNLENIYVYIEHGEIVSCAGVKRFQSRFCSGTVDGAMVGGVCTREQHRGRGFSGAVMKKIDDVLARSCSYAVLWTGIPEFYERFGWGGYDDAVLGTMTEPFVTQSVELEIVEKEPWRARPVIESLRSDSCPFVIRQEDDYKTVPAFVEEVTCLLAISSGVPVAYALSGIQGDRIYVLEADGDEKALGQLAVYLKGKCSTLVLNDYSGGPLHKLGELKQVADWRPSNLAMWKEYAPALFSARDCRRFIPLPDRI